MPSQMPLHFLKTRLCSLDGIYISPRGCTGDVNNCNIASGEDVFLNSWGFRDWISSGADNGKKYIAISAGLWPNDGTGHSHALLFSQSQEVLLQRLITWSEPHPHVAGTGTDPDTSWMTILASLAYEFGHIHWVATTIRNPGDTTSDFSRLNLCGFFNYWQYNNPKQLQPPNRWRAFRNRDTSNGVPIDHRYLPTNDDFDDATLTSDEKNDLFFLLYEPNKPWPSYFGALTPDEQFVETYVFHVLVGNQLDYATTPYLKSLPVLISYTDGSTHVVDIPNDFWSGTGKPALYSKMACIPS